MFLPALTLTLGYLGEYAIIMRSSLLDTMREDYLVLARAKGLSDVLVRNRHAVPNAILPVVALLAINFGFVLSGAIAVEAIFSWPGLGLATYEALKGPDLPMLQGLFLVFSASVIFFNLVADLLYGYLDPRVRYRERDRGPLGAEDRVAAAPPGLRPAWHEYRHHVPGMIGLIILVPAVAMALAAPLLADESGLRAINAAENPTLASPAKFGRSAPTPSGAT